MTQVIFAQTRELELIDWDGNGDVTIEFTTDDPPGDSTHRNMLVGVNESSEGFLRMISDNDLSFWTNNLRRLTIQNGGNVGIGTFNPGAKLEVSSDGINDEQTIVQILESTISDRPILLFSEGGSLITNGMSIEYDGQLSGTSNKMHINGIDALPKFTVESGGNVGIGETSPVESLDVNGNIGLKDGAGNINFYESGVLKAEIDYNGASLILKTTDPGGDVFMDPGDDVILDPGDDILFRSGGITRCFMNDSGDFGIGTTGPAAKLDVRHQSTSSDPILQLRQQNSDFARMRMTSNSTVEFWNIEGRSLGTDPEFNIAYNDAGTVKTAISVDGDNQRVGINDRSPTAALHVKQVGSSEEGLAIENDSDSDTWAFEIGANDLFLYFNGSQVGQFNEADGVYSPSSDRRMKENIETLQDGALTGLLKLQPSKYYFKHDQRKTKKSIGLIAQDVAQVFPEVVLENDSDDSDNLAIKYADLTVLTIKAIQEQQELIQDLTLQLKKHKS